MSDQGKAWETEVENITTRYYATKIFHNILDNIKNEKQVLNLILAEGFVYNLWLP